MIGMEDSLMEYLRHATSRWNREADYLASGFQDDYGKGQQHAFRSCAAEVLSIIEHSEISTQPAPSAPVVSVQQAWEWAGGNPGIVATVRDLEQALRDLDAVCDEADSAPSEQVA